MAFLGLRDRGCRHLLCPASLLPPLSHNRRCTPQFLRLKNLGPPLNRKKAHKEQLRPDIDLVGVVGARSVPSVEEGPRLSGDPTSGASTRKDNLGRGQQERNWACRALSRSAGRGDDTQRAAVVVACGRVRTHKVGWPSPTSSPWPAPLGAARRAWPRAAGQKKKEEEKGGHEAFRENAWCGCFDPRS